MADTRKTVGDLDPRLTSAFDGTEFAEVFPTSGGVSKRTKAGTVIDKDVGTSGATVPLLNEDANFTGALQKDGNDVVTTDSGTQTIAGDKTFSGAITRDAAPIAAQTVQEVSADATATAPAAYGITYVFVNAATATITLPASVPVGGRVHVKKIHATQGAVTITRSSTDTITRATLASVTLNANGDHWLLQKVSATRWELMDGVESGENGTGAYTRWADGFQEARGLHTQSIEINTALFGGFRSSGMPVAMPADFTTGRLIAQPNPASGFAANEFNNDIKTVASMIFLSVTSQGAANRTLRWLVTGRWYT